MMLLYDTLRFFPVGFIHGIGLFTWRCGVERPGLTGRSQMIDEERKDVGVREQGTRELCLTPTMMRLRTCPGQSIDS